MFRHLRGWLRGGDDSPPSAPAAHIPDGQRFYAVGDVHGRPDLLRSLLDLIHRDIADFRGSVSLVMIGDYIDRGPSSAEVIDVLLGELPTAWRKVFLRGNHEHAMQAFLDDPHGMPMWLAWGGIQALESYGIPPYGAMGLRNPDALAAELQYALDQRGHSSFFAQTQTWFTAGDYAFVHAGVRPGIPLQKQLDDDLLFIREDFLGRPHLLPFRVVFGHTIFDQPLLLPDRIGIDTGAFSTGVLTAAVLEADQVRFLQTASRFAS